MKCKKSVKYLKTHVLCNKIFDITCVGPVYLRQVKILQFISVIKIEHLSKSTVTKLQCDCIPNLD